MERSDQELMRLLKLGNELALSLLYERYAPKVRSFLNSIRLENYADDAIQDTFLKVWYKREVLNEELSFHSYVFTIAKNYALKALNKQLRVELMDSLETASSIVDSSNSDSPLLIKELQELVAQSLHNLPEMPRKVYKMRREAGKSIQEISSLLGVSPSTVENHMNKALNQIKKDISPIFAIAAIVSLSDSFLRF
ncbi:DNA-directed RNA polymerase sigma-70 factor [Marivirga lumbricoides]|uniref:DNA-directed RNA polymerase sigma-70 factor n=1 Tax=Marivirga lumbricoides TaxID=1046115 RepID=A0ABQ1MZ86_9BACT|nr:DNA-directed RNA polymerase sigma-70 factor [Marivirga lumbricoides]